MYFCQNPASMRKIFRVILIVIGSLLALMIILPVILKGRIEEEVKKRINREVEARVEWEGFSASLFRGFPTLSVSLRQFLLTGEAPFEGDTIAALERLELRLDPFSMFRKEVEVHSILLYRPRISGEVLESGEANWQLFPEEEESRPAMKEESESEMEPEGDGTEKTWAVSLSRLVLSDGELRYLDHSSGVDLEVGGMDLELRGDFDRERTDLALFLEMRGLDAAVNGIRYMKKGNALLELKADADLTERKIVLKKNELRLNDLTLEVEGSVVFPEDEGVELDLHFLTRETTFQTLLSLVPAIYLNDYESITTRGQFALEGGVQGTLRDSILPDLNLLLMVKDGYFAYPDLPRDVSDVQMNLAVEFRGEDRDASVVDIERLHLNLGGDPFDLKLSVAHPFSDMRVAGEALGTINFASIGDVMPLEDIQMQGLMEADLRWDARISDIEEERYDEVDMEGSLGVSGFNLENRNMAVPVRLHRFQMKFSPSLVELVEFDMNAGSSDLHMDGQLYNLIPYLFDNQVLTGTLNLRSGFIDLNELYPSVEEDAKEEAVDSLELQTVEDLSEKAPPDSLADPSVLTIPEKIDLTLSLKMDRVDIDQITATDVEGSVQVAEGKAHLDGLKSDLLQGKINLNGTIDTKTEYLKVDAFLKAEGIDIPAAYAKLVSVERLVPMARYCRGTASVEMQYSSLFDNQMNPLYQTIDAKGKAFTEGLQIYNLQGFVNINEMIRNEKIREMAPDEVEIDFTILNGRVVVDPFHIDFDDSGITVEGSHGLDHSLDYKADISIAKKDLAAGAMNMVNSMTLMARAAGLSVAQSDHVNVKATITGTFTKPIVKTDLSGNLGSAAASVREQLEQKVTEEVETVREEVRQEASERADQIILEAEQEAARKVDEARQRGDQLVREAEKQGENLVREAGNNPLRKLAAERASAELVSQAEKQSALLVQEAEEKADEIISKAKEEAARIQ